MQLIGSGLQFPEGPIALPDGSVLLVEIARGTLTRVSADGSVSHPVRLGGGPNGAAFGPDGRVYVCNNGGLEWSHRNGRVMPTWGLPADYAGGWIEAVDLATGKAERLYTQHGERPLSAPNDLVFDADGGFWFTDSGKQHAHHRDHGCLYWARADGSEIRLVAEHLEAPNGVGLSPDGRTLYVAETNTARLWAWPVTAPGELQRERGKVAHGGRFVAGSAAFQRFDSLAVAASGNVLVGTLVNGGITEISPDGQLVRHHPLPDRMVTNLCFGGPDLKTLFVTLAHSGQLAALPWHEPGLRLNHQAVVSAIDSPKTEKACQVGS
ncbi:MAG: SMP-30/gluconolactonase/LRE family protein [Burkholderiaceae bacterium]